ncbi:hypothetical protein BI364_10000 [Acidihalobacter yilgarnensis]|uniref:Uncharacterized protein n=1 Tax=Acidihalobacter yilgarnensis TaxID=2819280 RepID=A0A1D8IP48_9GAMM|nr:hypothetical protein [Acidihalobacter yilgarnensis]AOU98246.1 hypothetical protein BI364_10000 [Acidihalobacter yilgarnensis]
MFKLYMNAQYRASNCLTAQAPAAYKIDVQALIDRANDLVYGLQALSDKLNADHVTGGST